MIWIPLNSGGVFTPDGSNIPGRGQISVTRRPALLPRFRSPAIPSVGLRVASMTLALLAAILLPTRTPLARVAAKNVA